MSKKLVIKINNLETLDEAAVANKHQVEVFLWGRVFAAAAVVVFALGLIVWFFSGSDSSPDGLDQQQVLAAEPRDGLQSEGEVNSSVKSPVMDDIDGGESFTENSGSKDSEGISKLQSSTPTGKDAETELLEKPLQVSEIPSEAMSATSAGQSSTDVDVIAAAEPATAEPIAGEKSHQPAAIKILSKGIVRAQLTHQLNREKQPTDELGRHIHMQGEHLIRIYLFTDLQNLAGTTLYHDWYRNGDRMARVRIPVIKDRYRASSSKFIDRMMLGDWQVVITDDEGKRYTEVEFSVSE